MILEVPTAEDFFRTGISLLNQAWNNVFELIEYYKLAKDQDMFEDASGEVDYWRAASDELSTSVTLTHQGISFLIKGKIASVNPHLLILSQPKDWPKGCDKGDVYFSDFKTVDTGDLVKIHNTFLPIKLDESFVSFFMSTSRKRNKIMHSIDNNLRFEVNSIIRDILITNDTLSNPGEWFLRRMEYLSTRPWAIIDHDEYYNDRVITECSYVKSILTDSEMKQFFQVSKKSRFYICPSCHSRTSGMGEDTPLFAVLKPNTPTSTNVYCFMCLQYSPVKREKCGEGDCKGNVLADNVGCLSCGES
ncbi:hypothetical protein [Fundidesulfovibrio putealis]|uniref:hypothetical protein n=1 Tax=Fundidesulfovibrio putealis TaxID=270496 RepID=UPI0012EB5ED8|nr:hypothetical protein [Fundidesulfovibrio putealis]